MVLVVFVKIYNYSIVLYAKMGYGIEGLAIIVNSAWYSSSFHVRCSDSQFCETKAWGSL